MPKAERRSVNWRRVGVETQEAEGHRVHAQKDLITDSWRFVAVRKGDGMHECLLLGEFDTAKEARAKCEADVHYFHWTDPDREMERRTLSLQTREQLYLWQQEKEERKKTRKARRNDKKLEFRKAGWKT